MKIKDKNVKDILELSVKELTEARKDTYDSASFARQKISNVMGILNTLATLIDFDEE